MLMKKPATAIAGTTNAGDTLSAMLASLNTQDIAQPEIQKAIKVPSRKNLKQKVLNYCGTRPVTCLMEFGVDTDMQLALKIFLPEEKQCDIGNEPTDRDTNACCQNAYEATLGKGNEACCKA